MLKKLIISAFLLTATTAQADSNDGTLCIALSKLALATAEVRDSGMSADVAYDSMVSNGIQPEVAKLVITVTYMQLPNSPPIDVGRMMFLACSNAVGQKL
jgi:hypothetical protein